MTITATIDGWPYSISFGGTIDIERLSTGDVAIRRVSPGEALSCGGLWIAASIR
jgi:hypothetical protein